MKIMKATIIIALALSSTLAMAQPEPGTFSVTPKVGMTLNKMIGLDIKDAIYVSAMDHQYPMSAYYEMDESEYYEEVLQSIDDFHIKSGWMCGVDFQKQISQHWAFVFGLNYSLKRSGYTKGHDSYNKISKSNKFFDWDTKKLDYHLHYFQLPLQMKLYVNRGLAFSTGVQLCLLRQAYRKSEGSFEFKQNSIYYVHDILTGEGLGYDTYEANKWYDVESKARVSESFNRFDLSIPIALSYEFGHLVTELRSEIGTQHFLKEGDVKARNCSFALTLGYRFDL